MRKFYGYVSDKHYAVGCTGSTVYVYDKSGNELAAFKDIKYGYTAKLCPDKNLFVVKSTGAYFAVYSLDTLSLLHKIQYSNVNGSQDDGYCFSPDGAYFYNIERQNTSFNSVISVYDTSTFERVGMFLKEDRRTEPSHIEFGADGRIYVLGFLRGEDGVISDGFVSRFDGQGLTDLRVIPDKEYRYYRSFKSLELYGFTEKKKEMFAMVYPDEDLNGIAQKTLPLSELWEKYDSTINA